jgi:hypothetical protein
MGYKMKSTFVLDKVHPQLKCHATFNNGIEGKIS